MKILVTGGCGFIGSNFIINMINKHNDIKILNFDKITYAGNKDNLNSLSRNDSYDLFIGDISNNRHVNNCIESFKPNAIINFAAESHVDRSINNPLRFVKTNILGTANLLNVALDYFKSLNSKKNKFKFIHISTDEVYRISQTGKIFQRENAI